MAATPADGAASASPAEESVNYFFPEIHPIRFTCQIFPKTVNVKDASGAPWGCCVTPFVSAEGSTNAELPSVPIDQVARCEQCYAYINPFAELHRKWWRCPLCLAYNNFMKEMSKYQQPRASLTLPEMTQQMTDYELPLDSKGALLHTGEVILDSGYLAKESARDRPVVFLAVVDETGGPDYVEAVVTVLLEAVKALPGPSRLGLVTLSHRLGLFDLAAPVPHVQYVDIAQHETGSALEQLVGGSALGQEVDLGDVMSLEELACEVAPNRENMATAVRGLRQVCSGMTLLENQAEGHRRCVGTGLHMLLDLVLQDRTGAGDVDSKAASRRGLPPAVVGVERRTEAFAWAGVQVQLFLAGPPNAGPGCVSHMYTEPMDAPPDGAPATQPLQAAADHDLHLRGEPSAVSFYKGLASRAAPHAVSVSVHAICHRQCEFFGLASLSPLAELTGGSLNRHSVLHPQPGEDKALGIAADILADMLQPTAYDGLLRVRTTPEFAVKPDGAYGGLYADPQLERLWHLPRCGITQTATFDFEFTGVGDASAAGGEAPGPIVQVAYAYTTVVSRPSTVLAARQGGLDAPMTTVRRLRVITCQGDYSEQVERVCALVDVPASITALMHKVTQEALRSGVLEARSLLYDWLCNFLYSYCTSARGGAPGEVPARPEDLLASSEACQDLLKQVYGLLHSALLDPGGVHPDDHASLYNQFAGLEPSCVKSALYPEMQGFRGAHCRVANNVPLSRDAVLSGRFGNTFAVDALWSVVVYGASTAASNAHEASPLPPPRDSELGEYLARRQAVWRHHRPTSHITCRAGEPAAFFFEELLLDDKPLPDLGVPFSLFTLKILQDVRASLSD